MDHAIEQEQESYRSRLSHFKAMHNVLASHTKSLSVDEGANIDYPLDDSQQTLKPLNDQALGKQQIRWSLHRLNNDNSPNSRLAKEEMKDKQPSGMSSSELPNSDFFPL